MVYYQTLVQEGPPGAEGRKEGANDYELIKCSHDMIVSVTG